MEYIVQPGDTLFNIARRFGIALSTLIAVNPQIANPDLIYPGQVVHIPLMPPERPPVGRFLYVVQPGDTLFEIAKRFGVDLNVLINANPQIACPDLIFPGQVIFVPHRRPAAVVEVTERPAPEPRRPAVEVKPAVEMRPTVEVKPTVELKPTLEISPTLEVKPGVKPAVKPAMPPVEVPLFDFPRSVQTDHCDERGLPRTHMRPQEEEEHERHREHHHHHHHRD
ncbi:MAG: SafA/ExsA family spore coat assembly protein [Chitinophagales bacterium]